MQCLAKGTLDYMDSLTAQQIRRLFHLLSQLAFGQQQQASHIQVLAATKASRSSRHLKNWMVWPPAALLGWHAHCDPQTALQHCAKVQTHRHHRCRHDRRQHGSAQVQAAGPLWVFVFILWCFNFFTTLFVSSRSKGKESEKTSIPNDTFRQVTLKCFFFLSFFLKNFILQFFVDKHQTYKHGHRKKESILNPPPPKLLDRNEIYIIINTKTNTMLHWKRKVSTNSRNGLQAKLKFLRAFHIMYLSASNGRKDRTSLNHCRSDSAKLDFQLKKYKSVCEQGSKY